MGMCMIQAGVAGAADALSSEIPLRFKASSTRPSFWSAACRALCFAFFFGVAVFPAFAAPDQAVPARRARRALVTAGPFREYQVLFHNMLIGRVERGLIADGDAPLREHDGDVASLWAWAGENAGGDRLEFPADAFYSADWREERRAVVKQQVLERIRTRGDIDCILALGTWAGQDFSTDEVTVPVLVTGVTDAVEAGIVLSVEDSGRDNLVAVIDPGRITKVTRFFHNTFDFKRLGFVEDSPPGSGDISYDRVEKELQTLGAEPVYCASSIHGGKGASIERAIRDCCAELAERGVDAVWFGYNNDLLFESIPDMIAPLVKAGVPTFSRDRAAAAGGILMSVSSSHLRDEGDFSAGLLAEILRGKRPRDLTQRFASVLSVAVNLRTAGFIGWDIPLEILAAVDEFDR
jgi:ABC-type uncharacterized transport system substrate-binding protein